MEKERKQFLKVISDGDKSKFLQFVDRSVRKFNLFPFMSYCTSSSLFLCNFVQHYLIILMQKAKTDPFDLAEFFQVLPNKEHVSLFESLHKQLKTIIESSDYMPSKEQDAPEEQDQVFLLCASFVIYLKINIMQIVANTIRFMKGFVAVAQAFLKDKKRIVSDPLRKSICLLHDIIMELYQFCHTQQPAPRNGTLTLSTHPSYPHPQSTNPLNTSFFTTIPLPHSS